jgi:hypothetical protein
VHDDILYLGSAPAEENCVEVGDPDYSRKAKVECRAYIEAIRKVCGREPEGARLSVKSNAHDYGVYYDVVVRFDGSNEAAAEYAYRCEGQGPTTWAASGMEAPELNAELRR